MKFFSVLCIFTFLAVVSMAKTNVAAVFANPELCKTKMCLQGQFKKGASVVLLSKTENRTCRAKVGKSFTAENAPGPFKATELTSIRKCKIPPGDVFLAVFDRPGLKYEILKSEVLDGPELVASDLKLKKDSVFKRAWKQNMIYKGGNKDLVPYELNDFRQLEPVGVKARVSKYEELRILRHKFADGSNDGFSFAYFRKTWSQVSSSFTAGEPFAFSINGRFLIQSSSTCQMACGMKTFEVYEYNGRVFKMVY